MDELVFEVTEEPDGGYVAECLGEDIFTQGDTWAQVKKNVIEAVGASYFDSNPPQRIRLHLTRDEVVSAS